MDDIIRQPSLKPRIASRLNLSFLTIVYAPSIRKFAGGYMAINILEPSERQLRAPALNWFSQKATFRNGPSFLTPALYMEKGPGLTPSCDHPITTAFSLKPSPALWVQQRREIFSNDGVYYPPAWRGCVLFLRPGAEHLKTTYTFC